LRDSGIETRPASSIGQAWTCSVGAQSRITDCSIHREIHQMLKMLKMLK
jgi:hypothetical protein